MAKVTITSDLIKDLKKYGEQMCVGMAAQVRKELTETTASAIQQFYDDYNPVSYRRHYWNFEKNSFKPFYANPHGSVIRGGVELTPYEMEDIYQQEPQEVFSYVYAGYHGLIGSFLSGGDKSNRIPRMDPSPLEIIENRRYDIVSHIQNYEKFGYTRANKGVYSTLI